MLTMSKFISLVTTFYVALVLYFQISSGRFHVFRKVNIPKLSSLSVHMPNPPPRLQLGCPFCVLHVNKWCHQKSGIHQVLVFLPCKCPCFTSFLLHPCLNLSLFLDFCNEFSSYLPPLDFA